MHYENSAEKLTTKTVKLKCGFCGAEDIRYGDPVKIYISESGLVEIHYGIRICACIGCIMAALKIIGYDHKMANNNCIET